MRRYRWILMLFLSLFSLAASGQQNFASISFGATIPQGDYAGTGDLSSNGYARTGGAIKFDAGFFPVSYFGIGGSFSFGSNYASRDSLIQDMVAYIEDNASSIIDIPDDAEIIYGSGFWNYINLFLGPHFSIRASQRLYFDFRGLAGMTVLRSPDQDLRINFDGTDIYTRSSRNRLAFGFTAGGGLRYNLNSDLALKLAADYFQSKAKFEYTFDLFQGVAEDVPPLNSDFLVRTIELTVGLAYSF
ncbi:MAG: outer membrane beta-barrel protein [Bacteroidota bacterium]